MSFRSFNNPMLQMQLFHFADEDTELERLNNSHTVTLEIETGHNISIFFSAHINLMAVIMASQHWVSHLCILAEGNVLTKVHTHPYLTRHWRCYLELVLCLGRKINNQLSSQALCTGLFQLCTRQVLNAYYLLQQLHFTQSVLLLLFLICTCWSNSRSDTCYSRDVLHTTH